MYFLLAISLIGTVVVFVFVAITLKLAERELTANSKSRNAGNTNEKSSLQKAKYD